MHLRAHVSVHAGVRGLIRGGREKICCHAAVAKQRAVCAAVKQGQDEQLSAASAAAVCDRRSVICAMAMCIFETGKNAAPVPPHAFVPVKWAAHVSARRTPSAQCMRPMTVSRRWMSCLKQPGCVRARDLNLLGHEIEAGSVGDASTSNRSKLHFLTACDARCCTQRNTGTAEVSSQVRYKIRCVCWSRPNQSGPPHCRGQKWSTWPQAE